MRDSLRKKGLEKMLKIVVKEGEGLENELRKRSQNRDSRVFAAGDSPAGTIIGGIGEGKKKRPLTSGFVTSAPELVAEVSLSPISDGEPPVSAITLSSPPITPQQQEEFTVPAVSTAPVRIPSRRATIVVPIQAINAAVDGDHDDFDHDTDEEDEFVDGIENNALPNMLVYEALTSPSTVKSPGPQVPTSVAAALTDKSQIVKSLEQQLISTKTDEGCYAGYINMQSCFEAWYWEGFDED